MQTKSTENPTKKIVRAMCSRQFKQFEGIFDMGDEVIIEPVYYDKDTVLVNAQTKFEYDKDLSGKIIKPLSGKHIEISPAVIAKKGEYKTYHIKSKDGNYYSEASLFNAIGYKSLGEIFTLIK